VLQKTVFLSRACDRRIDEVHGLIAGNPSSIPIPTFPNYILRVAVDSHPLPGRIIVRPAPGRVSPPPGELQLGAQPSYGGPKFKKWASSHHSRKLRRGGSIAAHCRHKRLHAVAFRVKEECRVPGLWTVFSGSSEMGYGFGFGTRIAYNMCQSGHGQRLALRDCAYLCDLWRT
jgi:hypothetical protein